MIEVIHNGKINQTEMTRDLREIKNNASQNLNRLDKSHLRLKSPHAYVAGLEQSLLNKRNRLRQLAQKKKGEHQNGN